MPPPYTVTAKLLYSFLTAFLPLNRVIAKTRKVRLRITRVACMFVCVYIYIYIYTQRFKVQSGGDPGLGTFVCHQRLLLRR
jgi:hypothetical protein